MSSIRVDIKNIDAWFDLLDAHHGPGEETIQALDDALHGGFVQTQTMVHIITGSLKASGREDSSHDDDSWSGTITYGGPAPGAVNDPVDYARYEFGRGGDHDALRNVHLLDRDFEEAMFASVRAAGGPS